MKPTHTLLLVCLGVSVTPLGAQQPTAPDDGKTLPPHSDPRSPRESTGRKAEQKPVAYLGVLTREVPPELQSQFSLPDGFGLMVEEVMPDSPAQAAGLKTYDVLLKFDDQRLVNMEQLMALVRARKKGDTASLTVITGGKETQIQVTLAERLMPDPERQRHPQNGFGFSHRPQGWDWGRGQQEHIERFQKEMREYQERLQDWTRGNHSTPMPQPPTLNIPLPAGQPQRSGRPEHHRDEGRSRDAHGDVQRFSQNESHAAVNITRRDESGEYTLRKEDDRATFTVLDKDGKEQSWPVNNEEERKAVPEQYQDKLRDMEKGVRIERNGTPPGSADPRPTPPPSAEPRPQGEATSA